ncbi:unnamed protein product, partial [Closterium sp. NIES-53]
MFQHIKDLVELDDSGPKAWKLLRDVIQPNTLPIVIVLEKELAALSMRPGDDVKPVLEKIKDTYARMAAAGSNVSQMTSGHLSGYGSRLCRRTSAGTTRVVVLPTKLLRGIELQEVVEEEGEGEAEAVGEALAEGEAKVTITRGMGALCFSRPEGWAPPGMKPPSGERAQGGAVQGSGAQGDGAQGKANPGMFLMPDTLLMVIVLEKELAALSMRPGDDVKPVLDKIKDTYARMAAAGSNVSHIQQCTKIISVLDNSWDNLIPTLNTQQDQWTPEWLRQQILQEDFRRRHTGGGAANKTAEGYGAAGGSRGRGGGRGRG